MPTATEPHTAKRSLARVQAANLGRNPALATEHLSSREYICALIERFPSIHPVRPEDWDVVDFMEPSGESPGTRHARTFIACVWNRPFATSQGWSFDAIEAISTWDHKHRVAFATWAASPYFP